MRVYVNFGEADPVFMGEVELFEMPTIVNFFKEGSIEDGNGCNYFYTSHEVQVSPFQRRPVLQIYFHDEELYSKGLEED